MMGKKKLPASVGQGPIWRSERTVSQLIVRLARFLVVKYVFLKSAVFFKPYPN